MIIGIGWSIIAAVMLGVFGLPQKYAKGYEWENIWGTFYFFAMFILIPVTAIFALKGLFGTYAQLPPLIFFGMMALGLLWGVGNVCWGHGISGIGLSLAYSLLIGTVTLVGSLLPFFLAAGRKATSVPGIVVLGGIFICILGVAASGYSGVLRDRSQSKRIIENNPKKQSMLTSILICVLGGVFAAGFNIAFHIGANIGNIPEISQRFGNPIWLTRLAVLAPICIGAGITSFGYAATLLSRNNTWKNFRVKGTGRNLFFGFLMALFHDASLFVYGIGAWKLGVLGTSVGFAIFETGSIIVSNILGLATGEWEGASPRSKRWMGLGLAVLILGIVIISVGNALWQRF